MQTDYLITGAGASGLAFLDTLLSESDAQVVILDRRDAAGGHWNDAYPFVRLHQSASFYGVESRPLCPPRSADDDPTAPYYELSRKAEILAYFHGLMDSYEASGRVTFLRNTAHLGGGRIRNRITGAEQQIEVRRKIVNAGIWGDHGSIPATHTPKFDVAPGTAFVPINDLPRRAPEHQHFAILGAGKTGMDAAVWLLERGVDPARITWVRPNDYWLFNRNRILNHPSLFASTAGAFLTEMELLGSVDSVEAFCAGMEEAGVWHRIDPAVTPTRFHAATCSEREVALLAQITNVLRQGHVTALSPGRIEMTGGTAPCPPGTLFADCTARAGVVMPDDLPRVFTGDEINLNLIRPFQPLFGAALIALLEARVPDDNLRYACTHTVNFHNTPAEYVAQFLPAMLNQGAWSQVPEVKDWMRRTRLQAMNHMLPGFDAENPAHSDIMSRFRPAGMAAMANIPKLLDRARAG